MAKVYRNPELERRVQERIWAGIARKHATRIKRELTGQYDKAAAAVAAGRKPSVKPDRLQTSIEAVMRDAFTAIGKRTDTAIKDAGGKSVKRAVAMSPEFERGLNRYIKKNAARKVTEIDDTTRERIATTIRRGIQEGKTNAEVAAEIRQQGKIDSAFRSAMIARTESHSAANAGSLESAAETGVVKEKEWIATEDDRTRDGDNGDYDHVDVANVPIDEPFIVSGEELMYPGDPSGSAGNIINCRCAIGYVV